MFIHPSIRLEIVHQRQRELLARGERHQRMSAQARELAQRQSGSDEVLLSGTRKVRGSSCPFATWQPASAFTLTSRRATRSTPSTILSRTWPGTRDLLA